MIMRESIYQIFEQRFTVTYDEQRWDFEADKVDGDINFHAGSLYEKSSEFDGGWIKGFNPGKDITHGNTGIDNIFDYENMSPFDAIF